MAQMANDAILLINDYHKDQTHNAPHRLGRRSGSGLGGHNLSLRLRWLRNLLIAEEAPHSADEVLEHLAFMPLLASSQQCLIDDFWDLLRIVARGHT